MSQNLVLGVQVRLARYPCVMRGAALLRYRAHAAHITGVRWISQGKRLVSAGGRDACVLQWHVKRACSDRRAPPVSERLPDASTLSRRSTAQLQFAGNESLVADILGTSRRLDASRLSCTVQPTPMQSQCRVSDIQRTHLSGSSDHWPQQASKHTEPGTITTAEPDRSVSHQFATAGAHTWTSKAAKAESKSKVLTNRMSVLEHIQTAFDSELQDLKRAPRCVHAALFWTHRDTYYWYNLLTLPLCAERV